MAWTDKQGRLVCGCGGYWFPHRKGSLRCWFHPNAEYFAMIDQGMDHLDAMIEIIWHSDKKPEKGPCPF